MRDDGAELKRRQNHERETHKKHICNAKTASSYTTEVQKQSMRSAAVSNN